MESESRFKQFLNHQANLRLHQFGYSDPRARDAKREAWWWLQARLKAVSSLVRIYDGWAIVWVAPGVVELVRRDVPAAGRAQATVALEATAVSLGTERAQFLRLPNARVELPHLPGYSGAGLVVGVGRGVRELRIGDRVAVIGASHASVETMPLSALVPIPPNVDIQAASTGFLGAIALNGVRVAEVQPGQRVTVLGAGAIGQLAARIAAATGAEVIISRSSRPVGQLDNRVQVATVDELKARRRSQIVIDATGDPETISTAVAVSDVGARIVVLGSPRGRTEAFPLGQIRERGISLVGAHIEAIALDSPAQRDERVRSLTAEYLDLLARKRLTVSDLIAVADPREPAVFYRDLATSRSLVSVVFDWTRVPPSKLGRMRAFVSLPDLAGRGTDLEVPAAANSARAVSPLRPRVSVAAAEIRVGLLGCGDIGIQNANAIGSAHNTRLVACYDPEEGLAREVAGEHGAAVALSPRALFDDQSIDAVLLSVPHYLHAPLALDAIEAGKHVIVEKPLAVDLASAHAIVEAADRAGVVVSTCFPHRYHVGVEAARELIRAGALGPVAACFVSLFTDKPPSYWVGGYSGRAATAWRGSRELAGGGVLIMNLPHYLDLIRYVTGLEASSVSAITGFVEPAGAEVEDTIALTIEYETGMCASIFGCSSARGMWGRTEFSILGRDGQVVIEPDPKAFSLRMTPYGSPSRWNTLPDEGDEAVRTRYLTSFAAAATSGKPVDVSGRDGLAVQAIIEAAYLSAANGSRVEPSELLRRLETRPVAASR